MPLLFRKPAGLCYDSPPMAGLPALQGGESGQVRKEAATATDASAGGQARHPFFLIIIPGIRADTFTIVAYPLFFTDNSPNVILTTPNENII